MKAFLITFLALGVAAASPIVHIDTFGRSLGGWDKKDKNMLSSSAPGALTGLGSRKSLRW
ncbi:hypothetical protein N9143_00050 [bacterium]|nr:hypothetical protein [bacterium]